MTDDKRTKLWNCCIICQRISQKNKWNSDKDSEDEDEVGNHYFSKIWLANQTMKIFISFIDSNCEAKDSQKSELNHYTSQEPKGEKTKEEVSVLDVAEKNPEN